MTECDMSSHHGDADPHLSNHSNQTIRLLLQRASCRSFEAREIPNEVMQLVLRVGTRSATGGNLQPYSIIKTDRPETHRRLAELCGDQPWIAEAAVNLLFCIDYHRLERWARLEQAPFTATQSFRHFWIAFQDTIIAAQNICTAADAMGLGSVYIGTVLECLRELKELFQLPNGVFPVVLLSMGYPKVRPEPRRKLGTDIVVHNEKYKELGDEELLDTYRKKYPQSRKEINEERLAKLEAVCCKVEGEDFARRAIERIRKQGYISVAHNYFALHYRADEMPLRNEEFLAIMEQFGFDWFKKYRPKEDSTV